MNIMVVSPHPDDETLGAGGSILKLKALGSQVYWLNITDVTENTEKKIYGGRDDFINKRKVQIDKIIKHYQFDGFINLKFSPAQLNDQIQGDLICAIGKVFDEIKPECLILPDYNDAHSDHKYVFEACYVCSKIFRRNFVKKILTMEILSETNFGKPYDIFKPHFYIDITDYMDKKLEAVTIYDTELGELPFPRNLEAVRALALLRGTEAGGLYAEAFRVIKIIL